MTQKEKKSARRMRQIIRNLKIKVDLCLSLQISTHHIRDHGRNIQCLAEGFQHTLSTAL